MRLLIILLFVPILARGQIKVAGRVTLCEDFKKTISISGKLSYAYHKDKKKRVIETSIDTIQADIYVYKLDSLIEIQKTDFKGYFALTLPEQNFYRLKFQLMSRIYKDTTLNLQSTVDKMRICLSDSGLHNYQLRKISYDSTRAKIDLSNDTVRIVTLVATDLAGCRILYLDYLTTEEKQIIENEFGFRFTYFYFEKIPQHYLDKRQNEYNSIVYAYLDKKVKGDSQSLIKKRIISLIREKRRGAN